MNPLSEAFAFATLALLAVAAQAQDTATIAQDGSRSIATIIQAENSGAPTATINQGPGTANVAILEQRATFMGAEASISQASSHQFARVTQVASDGPRATIEQGGGSGNAATVLQQDAIGPTTILRQSGYRNTADLTQLGGRGYRTDVRQVGNDNRAIVSEREVDGSFSSASVVQEGSHNLARLDLTGAEANVIQRGTGNKASIVQADGGTATIIQDGNGNAAWIDGLGSVNTIQQGGTLDKARISQSGFGGFGATILQNLSNPGVGNIATIIQRH